jgi:hypothetical protein
MLPGLNWFIHENKSLELVCQTKPLNALPEKSKAFSLALKSELFKISRGLPQKGNPAFWGWKAEL